MDTTLIPISTMSSIINSLPEDEKSGTGISSLKFTALDYFLFALMLSLSALIGIYYGFLSKRKQNNTKEYLLGGKQMHFFPVSASLIASYTSSTTLLGVPSEMYTYGTQYWMIIIPVTLVGVAISYIYLPVFHELQLTSSFCYLEKRFDRSVRLVASFIFAFNCLIFSPIVIYGPALAFSQVTGISVHVISPIISLICIFYTTVGGLRAVVWTDTLQFIVMMGAIIAVIFLGVFRAGGFNNVWEASERGGRIIFFNMDPSPFSRVTFWTMALGLSVMWIAHMGASPGCVQRFLAVPDIKMARKSVVVFCFGLVFIMTCCCYTGLVIYAKYESCDPLAIGDIKKIDQIVPYFVMDVAESFPGLSGLFVAGILSASLSTLSSLLNTLSGTIYEDFLRKHLPNTSEKTASNIMKCIVVIMGIINLSMVFIVEKMGAILQISLSLAGVTAGALLGLFTMGMIFPKANTKGVIFGSLVSFFVVTFIMIGSQMQKIYQPTLPTRIDGCYNLNLTNFNIISNGTTLTSDLPGSVWQSSVPFDDSNVHWIFKISFMYYALIGVASFFIVGVPVSLFTFNGDLQELDQRFLSPFIRDKRIYEKQRLAANINFMQKANKRNNDDDYKTENGYIEELQTFKCNDEKLEI